MMLEGCETDGSRSYLRVFQILTSIVVEVL